jgi:hypothetical protein
MFASRMTHRRPVQFAQRSVRHNLTVSVDHLDLQMRKDAADRADTRFDRLIA